MDELIDIYSSENKHIGMELKSIVHEKGLWHRTVCFLIIDVDKNTLIFQERSKEHKHEIANSNLFVNLNGGHLRAGEEVENTVRELKEELNIDITYSDIVSLGKIQTSVDIAPDYLLREFTYYFIVPVRFTEIPIKYNDGEVVGTYSVPIAEALDLMLGKRKSISVSYNNLKKDKKNVFTANNFKDFTDNDLYLRIFIAANRYITASSPDQILI